MGSEPSSHVARNSPSKLVPAQIQAVAITEVYFSSDHDLLLDNDADWLEHGSRYTKPEWSSAGRVVAVSHTKNLQVRLTLKLDVTARGTGVVRGRVRGKSTNLEFDEQVNLHNGATWVDVVSTSRLPDRIATYIESIEWQVTAQKKTFSAGSSGPHVILVTYGTPAAPKQKPVKATLKRLGHAVTAAAGQTREPDCVEAIWKADGQGHYNLGANPDINPWEVLGGARGDCSMLSDMFLAVCLMLGLPDKRLEKKFIYPKRNKAGGRASSHSEDQETRSASSDHAVSPEPHDEIEPEERLDWLDHKGFWNQYEACVLYRAPNQDIYYAGGTRGSKFTTPDAVVKALVASTAWKYAIEEKDNLVKYSWCFVPGPYPERLW